MKAYTFTQQHINSFTLWNRFCKELIVQKTALLFILFLTASFIGNGQTTDSGPFLSPAEDMQVTLQKDEIDKLQNFKENTHTYKSVTLVHTADISKFQKGKRIPFYLPGIKGNPMAKARKIEAYSLEDYTWKGDFENEHEGTVILIAKEGEVFGQIRIDDQSYQLFSLKPGISILLEVNKEAMIGNQCDMGDAAEIDHDIQWDEQQIEIRGCSDPRILVVASPAAETALGGFNGVRQLAQVAIGQLNDVFDNSDLNISATLAGVEILDGFNEPDSIQQALNQLITVAADERDDHFADLVVLITERYNTGTVGIAQGFGPPNAFAVVNENVATNELTFVHEVGHLYGARHQSASCNLLECTACDFNSDFAHAHHFETGVWPFKKDRWTVMRGCTSMRSFIGYFSNPNVDFKNKPTGVTNSDNARRVNNNRCGVGNLRGDPPPPMTVTINGPYEAYNTGTYTWCASVSNCNNVTFYAWEYSTDGFNYSPWNFQICKTAPMPFDEDLYLRITTTCSDGRTATDFHFTNNLDIPNQISSPVPFFRMEELNLNISKDFNVLVSPNPVSDNKISYTLKIPEEGRVSVVLMDQLGRNIYTLSEGNFQKRSMNISKAVPSLTSGMYFLRIIWKDQSITKKVIIQ